MPTLSLYERILQEPAKFDFKVPLLGPCKIDSPLHRHDFISDDAVSLLSVRTDFNQTSREKIGHEPVLERAGAHRRIFHDPAWSRAAILTAGGLCPGLNHVIKGLVEILTFDYNIKTIYGIRYGYAGLNPKLGYPPMMLNPDVVDTIHETGGTILGSSRGQQDTDLIVDTLCRMNINLLFCIGGDGSLRCAKDIAEACLKRRLPISVVGIPKTIDNDLNFIGRSFGFETSVGEAVPVIKSAHTEARGAPNGIGLVKLMGRDSGFITAFATLANPVVNFCLVPEVSFEMDGPHGLLSALQRRFATGKGHTVIVVAEGAGQNLMQSDEERDPSGNILKKDIGAYLKTRITHYFRELNINSTVKYFDPSYTIRSVPAKGTDAIRCYQLARMAVHAAMAGRTNCVVGNLNDDYTLVPIPLATMERNKLDLNSDLWHAVLDATGQERYFNPDLAAGDALP